MRRAKHLAFCDLRESPQHHRYGGAGRELMQVHSPALTVGQTVIAQAVVAQPLLCRLCRPFLRHHSQCGALVVDTAASAACSFGLPGMGKHLEAAGEGALLHLATRLRMTLAASCLCPLHRVVHNLGRHLAVPKRLQEDRVSDVVGFDALCLHQPPQPQRMPRTERTA